MFFPGRPLLLPRGTRSEVGPLHPKAEQLAGGLGVVYALLGGYRAEASGFSCPGIPWRLGAVSGKCGRLKEA